MRQHVTVLGILFLVLGALGLIGFFVIVLVFGGAAGIVGMAAHDDPDAAAIAVPIIGTVGGGIALLILVLSIPDIVVGFGLLGFRPWARILGIVLCVLGLFHFPLGTAVSVYGLWVLFSPETEALFRAGPSAR